MYGDLDDRESDVINLAGILYAALTGRWPGVARSAVPRAPPEGRRPLRPRQVRAGVPRTLDTICERVLHQEASQHAMPIETAQEIAAALADYVGDPGQAAPLEVGAMHVEPTVSIPRGDLTAGPAAQARETSSRARRHRRRIDEQQQLDADPGTATIRVTDTDDLEAPSCRPRWTRWPRARASTLQGRHRHRPSRTSPSDRCSPTPSAGSRRRTATPRPSGMNPAPGTWSDHPPATDETGTPPGTDDAAGFWPFVDADDDRNDVHTGKEGRGWLRIGVVVGRRS